MIPLRDKLAILDFIQYLTFPMQIHWHEGLFLLPHHLQRFQRMAQEAVRNDRKLCWAYPYGVVDACISHDDLENMQVKFERLHAVMPSGLEVDFPAVADLPVINIKEALLKSGSVTVCLAVPLWSEKQRNCIDPGKTSDGREKILFKVVESTCADENTGENPKPMLNRRINARLILEEDDRSDLEVIPLLRVVPSTGDKVGVPKQDPSFMGPCLVLNGSTILREMMSNLNGQLQASRKELVIQVNRGGFSLDTMRGVQFEQLMRLRTLNRFGGRLESLINVQNIPTFDYYLLIRELLGELSALHPEKDIYECSPYDHDSPYACLNEIVSKVRLHLRGAVTPNFIKVDFVDSQGMLQANLTDSELSTPSDYFLGIETKGDPISLSRFVQNEDAFKLMPLSMANRAVRGILLKEERFPPLELPSQGGLYYYRLLRGDCAQVWSLVQSEKSMIVRWIGNEEADYKVSLYMVTSNTPA
jgi:type VI secretion system protein ImpJ